MVFVEPDIDDVFATFEAITALLTAVADSGPDHIGDATRDACRAWAQQYASWGKSFREKLDRQLAAVGNPCAMSAENAIRFGRRDALMWLESETSRNYQWFRSRGALSVDRGPRFAAIRELREAPLLVRGGVNHSGVVDLLSTVTVVLRETRDGRATVARILQLPARRRQPAR